MHFYRMMIDDYKTRRQRNQQPIRLIHLHIPSPGNAAPHTLARQTT